MRREILRSHEAAGGARGGGQGVGDRTMVKGLRAAVADGAQCRRQILLHQALPGFERHSLMEEYRGDVRLRAELSGTDVEYVDVTARQDESVLCQPKRRRHEDGPRKGAVSAAPGFEPQPRSWHAGPA